MTSRLTPRIAVVESVAAVDWTKAHFGAPAGQETPAICPVNQPLAPATELLWVMEKVGAVGGFWGGAGSRNGDISANIRSAITW